jgi:hypothetical protein
MGILDEAIRDHLDLKRRRGADPSEVERAEREALGPVRRNPSPGELAEADAEAAPEDAAGYAPGGAPAYAPEGALAYDHAGEEDWSHDSLQDPAADAGVQPVYDEPPAEPVAAQSEFPAPGAAPFHDADEPLAEEPFDEEPAHEPFPAPPAPPAAPPAMAGAGPETAEYDVEDALAAEERREQTADGEDVLEETPEFLQDTPDHDRLWFEQRPPKDFDFDE